MTIREIEQIESGLRVLSYECDEMLNANRLGNDFFHLYFNYTGFILHLKNKKWNYQEVTNTLQKFPRLVQPASFIFVPLFLYAMGLFFASSILYLAVYFFCMTIFIWAGHSYMKKRTRNDLMRVITTCSEMRMSLHRAKQKMAA